MKKPPRLADGRKLTQACSDAEANERGENEGMAILRAKSPRSRTAHKGGSNDTEITDQLQRRILAHEQILQALIAHMTETQASFLERLTLRFSSPIGVAHEEQDFIETSGYAERFIREVTRLVEVERSPKPQKSHVSPQQRATASATVFAPPPATSLYRIRQLNGVWHVTKDGKFYGDFHTLGSASENAQAAVAAILKLGGLAAIVYG